MGERLHPDNWLWVCCCCGCLPIFGFLKGIITFVPSTLIIALSCTIISIVLLPNDIFLTYYCFVRTKKLGPNITIMIMLLLPIPLILWPPSVLILSLIFGVSFGLFNPIVKTFDPYYNLICGGIKETLAESFHFVAEFWCFNTNSYFSYLFELRNYRLIDGEKPFDISLLQLIVGIIIGTIGAIVDGVFFTLISAIKLLPIILRVYSHLWKWYFEYVSKCGRSCLDFVWFGLMVPIFILANVLIPQGVLLGLILVSLAGFFMGLSASYIAYESGIPKAFEKMMEYIKEFNKQTNDIIFK